MNNDGRRMAASDVASGVRRREERSQSGGGREAFIGDQSNRGQCARRSRDAEREKLVEGTCAQSFGAKKVARLKRKVSLKKIVAEPTRDQVMIEKITETVQLAA